VKEDIILIGGGGHCRSCIDVIETSHKYRILGIIDLKGNQHKEILGYDIIGTDDDIPDLVKTCRNFLIAIGQIQSPKKRMQLFKKLKANGAFLPSIVSPLAYLSMHAEVAEGTIVMHHALINSGARIGKNCIINSKALIEHDVIVGDHCHISTGAILNGGVDVGAATLIGSGVVVKHGLEIGDNSIIGMGATVFRESPPHTVQKIDDFE
jgi:sugar O-acyltransferase (sialic acid O-acetyltransferase NeuD family)